MSTKRRTPAEAQARYARALAAWKAAKRYERRLHRAYQKDHGAYSAWCLADNERAEAATALKWAGAAVLRALGGPPAKELA